MNIYRFYVYAYLRSEDSNTSKAGSPYYIGKGTRRRAWEDHGRYVPVPKDKSRIVLLEQNLSNLGAMAIERRLIAWYGRKDLGTGILINRTVGGECGGSKKGVKRSERMKSRLSAATKGVPKSAGHGAAVSAALKGRQFTDEWLKNLSESHRGFKITEETRSKLTALKWWNNGFISSRAKDCPGNEWKRGRLSNRNN